jgi:hypothetical protein
VATDGKRQEILRPADGRDGKVHEFRSPTTDEKIAGLERRYGLIDRHNRPTHDFFASPARAVDAALARGAIAVTIPFARRQVVEALSATYPDRETADREIAKRLRAFYSATGAAATQSQGGDVDQLVTTAQFLYARNVFPVMNVSWGTHPNNVGHTDAPGCFRCHDDQHKSAEGRVIRQDCDLCHEIQ